MNQLKDSISKKRQEISKKITFWEETIKTLKHSILPGLDPDPQQTKQVDFCWEQIKILHEELNKLTAGTPAQRGAGWARGSTAPEFRY